MGALVWSSCSGFAPEPATSHTPGAAAVAACQPVWAGLPERLGGQPAVISREGRVAYWGDGSKRIVLRCGVAQPTGLEASSRCDRVNGVDWYTEQVDGQYRFTTMGRLANLEVTVPPSHRPEGDVLNELSSAVTKVPQLKACV